MDRYNVETLDRYDMEKAPGGMWVMFDDAQAAIALERERWASVVAELHAADAAYGCGFYNDERWLKAYRLLQQMAKGGA